MFYFVLSTILFSSTRAIHNKNPPHKHKHWHTPPTTCLSHIVWSSGQPWTKIMMGPSSFPSTNVRKPGRVGDDDDTRIGCFLLLLRLLPLMMQLVLLRLVRQPLKAPKTRSSIAFEARCIGDWIGWSGYRSTQSGLVEEGKRNTHLLPVKGEESLGRNIQTGRSDPKSYEEIQNIGSSHLRNKWDTTHHTQHTHTRLRPVLPWFYLYAAFIICHES